MTELQLLKNHILNNLNSIHNNIKFAHEKKYATYYLGLTIKKTTKESNIFRKLRYTNQQYNSNPQQIKTSIPENLSTFSSLIHRLMITDNTIKLQKETQIRRRKGQLRMDFT